MDVSSIMDAMEKIENFGWGPDSKGHRIGPGGPSEGPMVSGGGGDGGVGEVRVWIWVWEGIEKGKRSRKWGGDMLRWW